jgi:hypothetical protein
MAITSKNINLFQLDQELGGQGLNGDFNDLDKKVVFVAESSTVTEAQLEAAIAAHIALPTEAEVKMLNRQEGIAKLKELGFTDDQIAALISDETSA